MTWQTYEEVVKKIYEALGKDKGVSVECWGSGCKVVGKSNVKHQIDVLTSHSDGLHTYKTAIECKYWDQTISKDILMKVREIADDANLQKAIVVSKLGFTEDALTYGKFYNIGLVELRELTEEDWKGRIQKFVVNLEFLFPTIERVDFISEAKRPDAKAVVSSLIINVPNGDKVKLTDLTNAYLKILCKKKEGEQHNHVFKFPEGSVLTDGNTSNDVLTTGVQFQGTLRVNKRTIEINGRDHVWLIMKSVFEDKRFVISKDGVINEVP